MIQKVDPTTKTAGRCEETESRVTISFLSKLEQQAVRVVL